MEQPKQDAAFTAIVMFVFLATMSIIAAAKGQEIEERIYDLPTFSHKCYLTIVYRDGRSENDIQLYTYLRRNTSMRSLTSQTVFNEYTYNSPLINQTAWRTYLGNRSPAILLQAQAKSNGRADVIFFDAGDGLHNKDLPRRIQQAIDNYVQDCPDCFPIRPRPKPEPEPSPKPVPDVHPEPQPLIPTIEPEPQEEKDEDNKQIPLLFFLAPAAGAALAMRSKVKEG